MSNHASLKLLAPLRMPAIEGIDTPSQLYWILDAPAPLCGMIYPNLPPWQRMHDAGLRHIVCLTHDYFPYDAFPLGKLHAVGLQDLYGGRRPAHPAREEALIGEAARVVERMISNGEGVVIHCMGGTGRTGTVIGCVLRSLGLSSTVVVNYLDRLHEERGRHGWPESHWQAEVVGRWK